MQVAQVYNEDEKVDKIDQVLLVEGRERVITIIMEDWKMEDWSIVEAGREGK